MTTPAPAPKSGMPKWLIIVLVLLLVVMFVCCGGLVTCGILARRAARAGGSAFKEAFDAATQRAEVEAQAAAQRAADDAKQRIAEQGAPGVTTPESNSPAASPSRTITENLGTAKMPANFPTDIPVMAGLTSNFSTADKVKGSGAAIFSGKIKHDDATAYYEKQMTSQGWKMETNTDVGDGTYMAFTKDTRRANVSITTDTDKTTSMVSIQYESNQ